MRTHTHTHAHTNTHTRAHTRAHVPLSSVSMQLAQKASSAPCIPHFNVIVVDTYDVIVVDIYTYVYYFLPFLLTVHFHHARRIFSHFSDTYLIGAYELRHPIMQTVINQSHCCRVPFLCVHIVVGGAAGISALQAKVKQRLKGPFHDRALNAVFGVSVLVTYTASISALQGQS